MIERKVQTEFGEYTEKVNHGYVVHSGYLCIDAFKDVPEHEYWEKCPCCGLKTKDLAV